MPGYRVLPGTPLSPEVLHVPHGSRRVPRSARERILLDAAALAVELDRMTDTDTGLLAARSSSVCTHAQAWRRPASCTEPERDRRCAWEPTFHTPRGLVEAARTAFGRCGEIALNKPFGGCYVPPRHYSSSS